MTDHQKNQQMGYLMFRITLGINFLFHGITRFGSHYDVFVSRTVAEFAESPLPEFVVNLFAHSIPIVEFTLGALLIVGFKTRWALILSSAQIALLMTGMCILERWDVVGIQIPYALCFFFLLMHSEHNHYSLDRLKAN